jgi:hypothetical protein
METRQTERGGVRMQRRGGLDIIGGWNVTATVAEGGIAYSGCAGGA